MEFLRFLVRRHPWPTLVMAVGLVALVWFGGRVLSDVLYFNDPAHREQPLAAWMSPRYVAKSWGLPPEVIARVMQLPADHRRITLDEVAERQGISLAELQQRVEEAKAQLEAGRQDRKQSAPTAGEGAHD